MRILLYDTTAYFPSSPLFLEALEEFSKQESHEFYFFDESLYTRLLGNSLFRRVANKVFGCCPVTSLQLNRDFLKAAIKFHPDVILIVKGAMIFPGTLHNIKEKFGAKLINYATDDPWNPRNNTRFLLKSIPYYDIYACTKRAIINDVKSAGCQNAVFVPFGYKPTVHFPESPQSNEEIAKFSSDVVFIGGCDSDRIPYFSYLINKLPNIRLHLYGGYWDRQPSFKKYYRGFAIGREYRLALGGAKIAVNLVRRANRDGHVMRTFEIPACGAFMLAENTEEHKEFFEENKEVAFFSSPEEFFEKINFYLNENRQRNNIAENGHQKVTRGKHRYLDRIKYIMNNVSF